MPRIKKEEFMRRLQKTNKKKKKKNSTVKKIFSWNTSLTMTKELMKDKWVVLPVQW